MGGLTGRGKAAGRGNFFVRGDSLGNAARGGEKIPGQEKYPARGTIPWARGEFTGKGERFNFFGRTPRYYPLRRGFPQKYWENFKIYWAREKIYWGRFLKVDYFRGLVFFLSTKWVT